MTMSAETTRAAHTIQPMNKLRSVYGKLESPLGDCTGTQLQVHNRRKIVLADQVVQIRRRSSVLHEQAWQELMHQLRFDKPNFGKQCPVIAAVVINVCNRGGMSVGRTSWRPRNLLVDKRTLTTSQISQQTRGLELIL
jgi:hypothetical protein